MCQSRYNPLTGYTTQYYLDINKNRVIIFVKKTYRMLLFLKVNIEGEGGKGNAIQGS